MQGQMTIRQEFKRLSTLQAEHLVALNGGLWVAAHPFVLLGDVSYVLDFLQGPKDLAQTLDNVFRGHRRVTRLRAYDVSAHLH